MPPRRGTSLVELMVVLVIMGVLITMSVPSYRRALEQSRADIAVANLRILWAAQRCYWLELHAYSDSLNSLQELRLIDAVMVNGSQGYGYAVTVPDPDTPEDLNTFSVKATCTVGTRWFSINQLGELHADEPELLPGYQ